MPRNRSRNYALSDQDIIQILDFDDSDEEGLLEVDNEDLDFLEYESRQQDEDRNVVEIVDAHAPEGIATEPEFDIKNIKWSKKFPPLSEVNNTPPDNNYEWGKLNLAYDELPTPLQVFKDVCKLDTLVQDIIIPQSTLYMQQKGNCFTIEYDEMLAFIGITVMMTYHSVPEIRDYFSNDRDLRVEVIAEAMSRERFFSIRRALHFADNEAALSKQDPNYDRAWKIRPLINHFNAAFQNAKMATFEQTIDERMTKFKGQNIMKQYMKDKPIQRGFKHWCRNDARSGYLYECDIYVGKKNCTTEVGLSENVVMQLMKSLSNTGCRLFIDNFYTSPALVYKLMKDHQIYACGTVRANRKGLPKNMLSEKQMKRGDIDARYCNGMSLVKWLDTKPVMMLSTIDSGNPENIVTKKRRQKGQDNRVEVKVPAMVQRYNTFMRGTDLLDQKTAVYDYDRKSPGKFYCRPFWDYIDIGIVNSFIVYQEIIQSMPQRSKEDKIVKTQKDFKRAVANGMIGKFSSRKKVRSKTQVRAENVRHKIEYAKKHGRCNWCYVQDKVDRKVFIRCVDCNIYLCVNKSRNCWECHHEKIEN